MRHKHRFLLQPGVWLGEGTVTFSASPERLHFSTRWEVQEQRLGIIACHQLVEMRSYEDKIENAFTLGHFQDDRFDIELRNSVLGSVSGKGLISDETIAWEFRQGGDIEGFEVYERSADGYSFHAEYASPLQYRTIIDGKIWLKG